MTMKKSRLDIAKLPEGGYSLRVRGVKFNQIFLLCLSSVYFYCVRAVRSSFPLL